MFIWFYLLFYLSSIYVQTHINECVQMCACQRWTPGTPSSPIRLHWLVSKSHRPSCLYLPRARIVRVCHHIQLFKHGFWVIAHAFVASILPSVVD